MASSSKKASEAAKPSKASSAAPVQTADAAVAAAPEKPPRWVILAENFGLTINGTMRYWQKDKVIRSPADIKVLLENNAPIEDHSNV